MPAEPMLESSPTEQRNVRTVGIDLVPTVEVLRLLNTEDATVARAVAAARPALAGAVDGAVARLRAGDGVHYFGAGTSGRMAVLDAVAVVPTFGLDPGAFVAHLALLCLLTGLDPEGPAPRWRPTAVTCGK